MRADRLVAVLLLLQQRGQVTAAEVAAELEVSERTARRDLDALGVAGIPVYATQGRGGGWRLAGGGKTDLSGLTAAEARSLFLVAGTPAGATPELRAALRKLVRALPEPLRGSAGSADATMVVDPRPWGRAGGGTGRPAPPHLDAVQQAVVDGRCAVLGYAARDGATTERRIHPLGLVSKGGTWYLIAGTDDGQRTFRVDRIRSFAVTGDRAERPEGFDLSSAWDETAQHIDEMRAPVVAMSLVDPMAVRWLQYAFGARCVIGASDPSGKVVVQVRGSSIDAVARELAQFAGWVTVIEPFELRAELAAMGRALMADHT
jgi:predicted DNA-binding transcriptional regulator YafY